MARRAPGGPLNAGVPAPEVARRAGHGVAVLLLVYAGCVDGHEQLWNVKDHAHDACLALLSSAEGPLLVPSPVPGKMGYLL